MNYDDLKLVLMANADLMTLSYLNRKRLRYAHNTILINYSHYYSQNL